MVLLISLILDLSDSDNYSPICSDNDESEPLPPQSEDCALSDHEEILKNRGTKNITLGLILRYSFNSDF